jgi:hypothetical protein
MFVEVFFRIQLLRKKGLFNADYNYVMWIHAVRQTAIFVGLMVSSDSMSGIFPKPIPGLCCVIHSAQGR